ncbi:MAG: (Fe-S)-binding protein [Myxococcota bacterium]
MDLIPVWSYVVLTLLLGLAGGTGVAGVVRLWRRIDPAGELLRRDRLNGRAFLHRGVLARRLLERPVSGSFHAAVLFGSMVLIVGHALFPLSFVGIPVYSGAFGRWFMGFGRDLAGAAVVGGVIFFLLRRAFPPRRLSAPQARRGFVAMELLLLGVLCAGFAAEAWRIAFEGSQPGMWAGNALAAGLGERSSGAGFRVLWWIHGLGGLGFIALIAHSPLIHILLGPINSALAPRRRGIQLPRIDFATLEDESAEPATLGASAVADFPARARLDFATCLWCGRCDEVCPPALAGRALSPKGVIVACAGYLAEGKLDDVALIDAIGSEATFDCLTCGACMEACPVSIRQPETILELRRSFVMERSEIPQVMGRAHKNLESRQHPFVGTGTRPDDWRQGLEVPIFVPGVSEYLLWIGCAVTYEERAQSVARAMVKILRQAEVSFGILESPGCTGDPAKQMGDELLFVERATETRDRFTELGVSKLITLCAHCFNSFSRYYPELDASGAETFPAPYEIVPHSVLIERLIREGRLRVRPGELEKITYHDPCYLARHNGITEAPRRALSAIGELVEMPRSRLESYCCGAGGANYWSDPRGEKINDVRAREALDSGAGRIATSCPFCLLMLTEGVKAQTDERRVFDIAELVEAALARGA